MRYNLLFCSGLLSYLFLYIPMFYDFIDMFIFVYFEIVTVDKNNFVEQRSNTGV